MALINNGFVTCITCGKELPVRENLIRKRCNTPAGVFNLVCTGCNYMNRIYATPAGELLMHPRRRKPTPKEPIIVNRKPLTAREVVTPMFIHGYTGCPITGYDFKYF